MIVSSGLASLLPGAGGAEAAYAAVQLPLAMALYRGRAQLRQILASPIIAAPVTLAGGILCGMFGPEAPLASLLFGMTLNASLGYAAGRWLLARRHAPELHRRGTVVLDAPPARAAAPDPRQPALGGHRVPGIDEAKHFKIIGTTGTGKSTAISGLVQAALARGDRIVIADPDGGYLRRYFEADRGDVILNPFDARSAKWDLFAEIRQPFDAEQLARALLPDVEHGDSSWCGYARTLLTALIRQCHSAGTRDVGELYRLITMAPVEELRCLAAGTPAQPFLEEHNLRMFDSIRSVASSATGSLEHVAAQSGAGFSIRTWIRSGFRTDLPEARGQVIFIPYRADQIPALRSTVSAWMRLAIYETMAGEESDRRLWFVVDELDALGKIDGLKDALARIRKFGGRCVLGFQSIAQVASTYGSGEARTIVENCGNTLILRCSASEGGGTARFASSLIGHREILRTSRSSSRRAGELLAATTRSEHVLIEPAVMDSQIEQLPDLAGYLKFASAPRWQLVTLHRAENSRPQRADVPAFVPLPAAPARAAPLRRAVLNPPEPQRAKPRTRRSSSRVAAKPAPGPGAASRGAEP